MRYVRGWTVGVAMVFVAGLTGGQVQAQDIPRLPDGKPDFNGVWQVLNTANYDLLAHAARPALATREGPFGPVPALEVLALGAVGAVPAGLGVVVGNEIPYLPEALEKQRENQTNWLTSDPEIKCYLPGVPRANYMRFPFQIFQSESALFIAYEYAGAVRNFHLEDPGEAPVDSWMGQSVASWDGDTLVVEVTGQNDRTWFDRSRQSSQQCAEGDRTLHPAERACARLRGDHRRSGHLQPSLDHPHAHLQTRGRGCATAAVQVRRIRRRTALWPPSQRASAAGGAMKKTTMNIGLRPIPLLWQAMRLGALWQR